MVRLRDVQEGDQEQMRRWRNLDEVARYMYTAHEITIEEHGAWFRSMLDDHSSKYWIIEWNSEGVGVANLYAIDPRHRRCGWAFYLASPGVRGHGVGSMVEYLVLKHVFEDLELNKLCCEVLASNEAVVAMHKRFGFGQEGYFREHVVKDGGPHDVVFLAMLRSDWLEQRPAIEQRLKEKGLPAP